MTFMGPKDKLSQNFTFGELCYSSAANVNLIPNMPHDCCVIANLRALCLNVLQPVRDMYRKPVDISSGYRCSTLNRLVGGSRESQHTLGEAADFTVRGTFTFDVAAGIAQTDLPFDQLIFENRRHGDGWTQWIHISHRRVGKNRREILTIIMDGEKLTLSGIHQPS